MFISNVDNLNDVALIESNGSILTYSDLYKNVSEFTTFFDDKHLVFIIGENNFATIVCYLSAVESGMVPLLLGSMINQNQLNNLIDVYKPKYIFQKESRSSNDLNLVSRFGEYGLFIRSKSKSIKLHPNLALLLTTSGSTGSPKLVRLTKKNLISNAKSISEYLDIDSDDRAITSLPYNYSYGLSVINTHLSSGGSLVLTNASMMEGNFWQLINKYSVTSLAGVPYNYEMILRLGIDRLEIPSIKKMTQAGGKLSFDKIKKISTTLQKKNIRFYSMYGQTEATARISYLPPEDINNKPGSIGKAIPNGKLWIENKDGELIDQIDSVGELIYSGENVSMGYAKSINDLELGDMNKGILRTGDLAKFDSDGYYYIEGSANRFVKIFGNRISLDSIEEIIINKGFESAATGYDDKLLIYVIHNNNLLTDLLRSDISAEIGINQTAIQINAVSEFPRLNNGKINYNGLTNIQ
tara:strand:- start:674 stop:2077 length:1404 start_codon:yes stop_codon:yes gene_type:complete